MPRLGSTVYSYEVGQKLDRDLVDDPAELLNLVNTGELESVLPPKDGTKRKLPPGSCSRQLIQILRHRHGDSLP